ncbi:hypothetical protein [Clavibacter sp. km1a]|jgi:hypothetical protein|uniref:hypothetical protein n=1 Tax=Clavibacter sp. km1a TaxID=3459136 RepID=UPI00404139C6
MTDPGAREPGATPLAEPAPLDADSVLSLEEAEEEDSRKAAPDPLGEGPDDQ